MDYMDDKSIRAYKIPTDDVNEEVAALSGYYYWHCPRCKKILDTVDGRMTRKCLHCNQSVCYKS